MTPGCRFAVLADLGEGFFFFCGILRRSDLTGRGSSSFDGVDLLYRPAPFMHALLDFCVSCFGLRCLLAVDVRGCRDLTRLAVSAFLAVGGGLIRSPCANKNSATFDIL